MIEIIEMNSVFRTVQCSAGDAQRLRFGIEYCFLIFTTNYFTASSTSTTGYVMGVESDSYSVHHSGHTPHTHFTHGLQYKS